MIKKATFLLLAFWMGFGQLAYASAKTECAEMSQTACHDSAPKAAHATGCETVPCQCAVEAPSSDRSEPLAQAKIEPPAQSFWASEPVVQAVLSAVISRKFFPVESPPAPPLYLRFSVYRI